VPEERRLVSVLFSDVAGSTALGEELDPEDLRALLARYFAIAKEVVTEHGGTLEKFIGDAVMAVFGMPQAHGDDASRAVAAALALRDRVRSDPRLAERLPIRIGVNTGEVIATRERQGDFLITGDPVNTAARLQQRAEPWSILAGERTRQAIPSGFAFGPALDVDARGKRDAVRAYPVLGRAAARAPARMPMFGREGDLGQLEIVAARVRDEGRPFLISLIAPAGTGKTRLLEEFLDRLPGVLPGATVAIAQCLPYGQRLTFWPLRAVLYRLVGIDEDAPPATVREAIVSWLNDLDPDAKELGPLIAATIGVGETEALDRAALFAAWRRMVELAARERPLVLVFEDLHWSSDSLLDLVEFVMQPRADARVLMLALTRPELLDRRPSWGGGRRNHLALSIEPLRDEAVAQIVRHLIEAPNEEVVRRVVQRAEGNPFYAGELVRSLIERAGGAAADPQRVERELARLPDTVQATVLARLDLLSDAERQVVQIGAVLGRSFQVSAVSALAEDPRDRARSTCEALAEKDLIRPTGSDSYVFRHILIREVAYQTLPRAQRLRLHGAAARWLEDRATGGEDAYAELVAHHWREAATLGGVLGDAAGPEARSSAVRWLTRAADVAKAAAAHVETARHLRAAIELAEPHDLPALYEKLGDARLDAGTSVVAYRTALDLAERAGADADQRLRLMAGLLMMLMRSQGNVADRPSIEAMQRLRERARALLPEAGDLARARFLVAESFHSFWLSGEPEGPPAELGIAEAERSARAGLELAERLDDPALLSAAMDGVASIAQLRGDQREVQRVSRERIDRLGDRLDLTERLDAYSMVTWSSVLIGELDEALAISERGLAATQPGQAPSWTLHLLAWRIYALALAGDWDRVLPLADRAAQIWSEAGRHAAGYAMRGFLAARDVALARADDRRAELMRDVGNEIVTAFRTTRGRPPGVPEAVVKLDRVALRDTLASDHPRRGEAGQLGAEWGERALGACSDRDWDLPLATLEAYVATARSAGHRPLEAQALRAIGLFGRDADALRRALVVYESMGARPYVARVTCELGRLTRDRTDVDKGLAVLRELGDQLQLARFER